MGNSSYTVAAWVKKGGAPVESALFYWGDLPVVAFHGLLCKFTNAAGKIYVGHDGNGGYSSTIQGIEDWHHIAIAYEGGAKTITVYCDGVQVGTKTYETANSCVQLLCAPAFAQRESATIRASRREKNLFIVFRILKQHAR